MPINNYLALKAMTCNVIEKYLQDIATHKMLNLEYFIQFIKQILPNVLNKLD